METTNNRSVETGVKTMLEFSEALEMVLKQAESLGDEEVGLLDALGRILAEEGQTVPMGAVIAEMDAEDEAPEAPAGGTAAGPRSAADAEAIDKTGVPLRDAAPVRPTRPGGAAGRSKPA